METKSLQIVIAQSGWIFVGWCEREGDKVRISEARNVRRWGTTAGLGELALKGPQTDTLLDDYGTVRIHVIGIVGEVECDADVWRTWEARLIADKSPSSRASLADLIALAL